MNKKYKQISGVLIISLFVISILPSVVFSPIESPNPIFDNSIADFTMVDTNIEINDIKSSADVIGTPSIYSDRFMELFDDLMTEGYLSPEGVPYHSIETFMIEAPDYGHMTTSEAFSFYVWLGAQYAQMTGDWSYYKTAWDITEEYMIPQQGVDQFGGGYNPSSPATYAAEEDLPSDYPNQGDSSMPTGVDPIANELASTYNSDGIYQMHWLMDVDNWYGYGDRGDGTSRTSFINTYQRGPQESVWETVPHPSYEDFTWGNENGFLPIFADFGDYAPQWRYTSASDADARQVQASYWALKYAEEQGVAAEIADYTSKASKMGDYLRYTMYDKYFKPIGIEDGSTVGTGEDSNTGLLTWYTSWGGAMDDAWGFRIGASHSHQGYQNPLAAYALSNVAELIPASPTAQTSWATSETRQIELAQYLQSSNGAIAGGVTNSYNGRYEPYPAGASTFYDMIYDESPVYEDPPSNNWFGMQVWGTERLIAHYLETGDARTKAISDKWVDWAISQTHLFEDGTFEIPSTLSWSGQPDTWTGTPTGNPGLTVEVENWGTDLGITGGFAKMLIEYAAATEKWEGTADSDAYTTAKELLDRMWTLYRDDVGLGAPEGRADYSRIDDEVYIPTNYNGVNGQGATLTNGMTFLDMRPEYLNDPDYAKVRTAVDAGEDPEMTYHRFWAQADIALALGMMHMYFPEEIIGTAPIVSSPADESYQLGTTGNSVSWTVTDDNPTTYSITLDGTPVVTNIAYTSGTPINVVVDGLAVGSHTYIITASDGDSLSTSDTVVVTVSDGTTGRVWMGDVSDPAVGTQFTSTIFVDTGTSKLASYGIKITFDPAIVTMASVVATANGFLIASNIDNVLGTATLAGFDTAGKPANVMLDLLTITWDAVAIGVSAIDIEVDTLTDETTAIIGTPYGESNTITVVPAFAIGDVNHDGSVTIVDALLVAQFYVGQSVSIDEALADVNLDGSVSIVDALLIAQYYVGQIPSLPPA